MNASSLHQAIWHKSSYSGRNTNCVEVAELTTGAAVRDTKHRDLGTVVFSSPEWRAFLDAIKG